MNGIEWTDRYEGIGYPDHKTVCAGQCEGTGCFPVYMSRGDSRGLDHASPPDETDPAIISLWDKAEQECPADDGWHFVQCPACNGTGKEGGQELGTCV